MTRAAEEALDQLRARLRGEKPPEPLIFEPPAPDEFEHDFTVMAFDPSLMHTGLVQINWPDDSPRPLIWSRLTFDIKSGLKGYWATWESAFLLQMRARSAIFQIHSSHPCHLCALEAPPVGGGNLRRTDSSLVAGTIIYAEAKARGILVREVSPNHVSSVLAGNVWHDKKEVAAAVQHYFPEATEWTEAECDAAAVGLTMLYDVRKAQS